MKTALLVIDVQQRFFGATPPPGDAAAVLERINALAERARARHVPVVWIQHEQPAASLIAGTRGWELALGLCPEPGDSFVRKTTPDSFLRTDLQALLDGHGVTEVTIAGYASEFCVDTTARRAAALGYAVTLAADAHTTDDKPHASAAMIQAHENATLPNITSFGPTIRAVMTADLL